MPKHFSVTSSVLRAFGLNSERIEYMEGGHINDSYKVTAKEGNFVLQRINRFVFPSPENVMENFVSVTSFLREKILKQGGNPQRETLTLRKTITGKDFFLDTDGEYWRCMLFIDGASSHEVASGTKMLKEAGRAFGSFQRLLSDYPAESLNEIIADFHNTPVRFSQLKNAKEKDVAGRLDFAKDEVAFAFEREGICGNLMNLLNNGELPLRVTHNDTKMSNVLIDDITGEAVCVIDLDTVMPGLTAFDFGDSIRAGATTAAEDERDLSIVHFDLDRFEAFTEGFLASAGPSLTGKELKTLPDGAILMTYEVGIRFLADYLNGDVYFRCERENQNLDRARNQFKLVYEMEQKRAQMDDIVKRLSK